MCETGERWTTTAGGTHPVEADVTYFEGPNVASQFYFVSDMLLHPLHCVPRVENPRHNLPHATRAAQGRRASCRGHAW
jgi:hypothetical protein